MTLYTSVVTLLLVMDPLGNVPVFLSVLKSYEPSDQRRIILREVLIAFLILLAFVFFGPHLMKGLNLSASALSVSGGIILFLIAIKMIFPQSESKISSPQEEPFIVPLAVPLTAGPSALAMVLLFVTQHPDQIMMFFWAVVIASFLFLCIVLGGNLLLRVLGRRCLIAIERLMGMILTAVAVQMLLMGILHFMHELPAT